VSSYDWLVSLVFMPTGYVVAGAASKAIGLDKTLAIGAGLCAAAGLVVLTLPSVRRLRSTS
jgi:hypothetical protein